MMTFRRIVWRSSIRSALFVMTVGAAPCAWGGFADGNDVSAFLSGNAIMERCKNTAPGELAVNLVKHDTCVAYLLGVVDSEHQLMSWRKEQSRFCMPSGTTSEQLRQVFLNDMTTHPQDWHRVAAGLVLNAFTKAWPCSE